MSRSIPHLQLVPRGRPVLAAYSRRVSLPSAPTHPVLAQIAALPLPTLVIMEIAAFHSGPFSLRRLIEVGRPLTAGNEFAPARLGPQIGQLIQLGFLEEIGDDLQCHPDLRESLAANAILSPRAGLIGKQILKLEPWSKGMLRDRSALWSQFRLHLFSGDFLQAQGLATNLETLDGSKAFAEVGRGFLECDSFLRFPPAVAIELARDTVVQSLNRPFAAAPAVEALGRLVTRPTSSERDRQLYAHALLMQGDLEAFDDYLESYDCPTLEGCRKLLEGRLEGLDDFERGLRQSRSFFSYTALFLYLVGVLAKEGLDSPKARREIERSLSFRLPMEWLLAVKRQEISEIPLEMRRLLQSPPEALVPHLCLILYWAGFRYDGLDTEARSQEYSQAGYPVFAEWVLWCGLGTVADRPRPPLLALLQPGEQWRHALSALSAWAAPYREHGGGERLVWYVEPGIAPGSGETTLPKLQLEVRVQKRSRKGGWSAGRMACLDSLSEQPPACADLHDRRVLDGLARRHRTLDTVDEALLLLVGHPRLYRLSSPEERIELVEEPVSVRVERFPDHLQLKLEPAPVWRTMVVAQSEPGRIKLYHYTERHVELGRMIASGLPVPLEGEEELKETLAGLAAGGLVLRSDIELAGEAEEVPCDQVMVIRLTPFGEGLAVQTRVAPLGPAGPLLEPASGSPVVGALVDGRGLQTRRDLAQESARFQELAFDAFDFITETPQESLELLEQLAALPADRFRVEWPEGERMTVVSTVSAAQMGQRVRSGKDWFALTARVRVDEDTVLALTDLLRLRRLSGSRFLPLSQGRFLALTQELEQYLERLDRLAHKVTGQQVLVHPLAGLSILEDTEVEADEAWRQLQERLTGSRELEPVIPASLENVLRPYQADGVRWLLRLAHWGVGACLADDMGLGKTLQLLTVMLARRSEGPTLVVAPTSVCWNWVEEAERFTPELRVILLGDARRSARGELGPGDVLVCSYGLLVNEAESLAEVGWGTVVLDEAQAIKNAGTQRSRAACALKAGFRVAATGTPVENHPEEMWSLFRYLNPGLLGSQKGYGQRFGGDKGQQELARLVRPFLLRRTKGQVLHELPPRTEILERVPMSAGESALYESLRRQAVDGLKAADDYVSVLAQLTRLRRVCCHPRLVVPEMGMASSKLDRFRELVEELVENGHRALVFSQFVSYLEILRSQLDEWGISYAYLDGSTPAAARRKAVKAFQEGQGDLFLISLKAGGTGLNLTGADYVIHMDPWWNPAVEDQASDRAHRMGQRKPVTVYRLVAQGTVEEQIVELHAQKRDLADRLLQGTESSGRLTAQDLLALLRS